MTAEESILNRLVEFLRKDEEKEKIINDPWLLNILLKRICGKELLNVQTNNQGCL